MAKVPYRRADLTGLLRGAADRIAAPATPDQPVRWVVVLIAVALAVVQTAIDLVTTNTAINIRLGSTMVPVAGFVVLLVLVALINPLVGLTRIVRPLTRQELMCVAIAMMVTTGMSGYGLAGQLVPLIPTPNNPEWNTPQRGWDKLINPQLRPELYVSDEPAIEAFRKGAHETAPPEGAPMGEHFAHYASVAKSIQWRIWLRPLACWGVFIAACYGMFYCLSRVVITQWAQKEKLIFPLARLQESLLPDDDQPHGAIPRLVRRKAFWIGLALSLGVLSWNALVEMQMVPGMGRIRLGMAPWSVSGLIQGSLFEGLANGRQGLQFLVIFTSIGIAFLLPLEITFSVWFYFWVGKLLILAAVWRGYGTDGRDFPSFWLWEQNLMTAQGAGAMLVFSGYALVRSLRAFVRAGALDTDATSRSFARFLPIIGLAASCATLTTWLVWNHFGLFWSIVICAFLVLLTLGLMRIVAETGVYWMQIDGGFFHLYRVLGMGKLFSPPIAAALMPIYWVLFLDLKSFIAAHMVNASKIQQDQQIGRGRFHAVNLLSIGGSAAVALLGAVLIAHIFGAQSMHQWQWSLGPRQTIDTAMQMSEKPPDFEGATAWWYTLGGAWTVVSLIARRTIFWFPHPIGYVMLVNPLVAQLWFSFFLGWLAKKLVVKYGGKTLMDVMVPAFVGLIMGELIAIVGWPLVQWLMDWPLTHYSLDRYGA